MVRVKLNLRKANLFLMANVRCQMVGGDFSSSHLPIFPSHNLPNCPSSRRSGLTLIELVLVIGIITLLAGIVYVVAAPIKRKATLSVCKSNFRQIYLAFKIYQEDRGGTLPTTYDQLNAIFFRGLILGGYIKDRGILHCPVETELKRVLAKFGKRLVSSYLYPANIRPEFLPEHYRRCFASKGDKVAILCDPWHNPPKHPHAPAGPTPFFPEWELVLRLNGQINWILVNDGRACR